MRTRSLVVAAALLLAAACSKDEPAGRDLLAQGERLPSGITVTSPDFDEGTGIPERFSCEGENVPPRVEWTGVPDDAVEVAVVLEDPDAPNGIFVHWIVTGLRGEDGSIGGSENVPEGAEQHPGSSDLPSYVGPCPPGGSGEHRYFFEVYALGEAVELPATAAPLENVRRIRAAASAGGTYLGTFAR